MQSPLVSGSLISSNLISSMSRFMCKRLTRLNTVTNPGSRKLLDQLALPDRPPVLRLRRGSPESFRGWRRGELNPCSPRPLFGSVRH
jgi:hypothetical protein